MENLMPIVLFVPLLVASLLSPLDSDDVLRKEAKAQFGIVEQTPDARLDEPAVQLGRELFWDRRLSANGQIACASCHLPEDGGADRRRFSPDAKGKLTARNSQTIFNAVLQPSLRWTGDRKSGAHQAEKSLIGSMGFAAADDVVPLLKKFGYDKRFQTAFSETAEPTSPANYGKAIEAYETTLVTPAPFDRFLAGDDDALSAKAKSGLALFITTGCADCHNGPLLGGGSLEKFGVTKDYWKATKSEKQDAGRFDVTQDEEDRFRFRVSMLRNIAETAPYFHDGSVATLPDAVRVMADVQLGSELTSEEVAEIVEFLESLTGVTPRNYSAPAFVGDR
jgi:cytochrome c peroxidase